MFSVPGIDSSFYMLTPSFEEEFDRNFKFRQIHIERAEKTIIKVMKKKKKVDLFIGIHVRRTDYQAYESARGCDQTRPSYYFQGNIGSDLTLYRQKESKVFFKFPFQQWTCVEVISRNKKLSFL